MDVIRMLLMKCCNGWCVVLNHYGLGLYVESWLKSFVISRLPGLWELKYRNLITSVIVFVLTFLWFGRFCYTVRVNSGAGPHGCAHACACACTSAVVVVRVRGWASQSLDTEPNRDSGRVQTLTLAGTCHARFLKLPQTPPQCFNC